MPEASIGIIGGTGLYDIEGFENSQWVTVESAFGEPSDQLLIGEFEGHDVAQFVAWLRRIHERNIINAARDHLQTQKRGALRETPLADAGATPAKQTSASRHAIRSEETERLRQALKNLPDDEREALRLRYLEGFHLTEIGHRMGLTKDALVWLLKRAMKNVRRHFPSDDG